MEAYYGCIRCMNKRVQLLTSDGKRHEGTIVNVDRNNVYLKQEGKGVKTSAFTPNGYGAGYNDFILTLSLFTLLAIALI